jgi:glycosyltransferase involved in cell wall biosynthesis
VVTLASVMKDHLVSRGVERDRITIIPNGVDLSRFEPMPRDERLASRLGIDRDHTVIGYVSTLKAYEGIETILEAVAELRARGTRAWALLVGSGDHKEPLRGRARELGIEPQVTFVGRVDHRKVHR